MTLSSGAALCFGHRWWVQTTHQDQIAAVEVFAKDYARDYYFSSATDASKQLDRFGKAHGDVGSIFFASYTGHAQAKLYWQAEKNLHFEKPLPIADQEYVHEVSVLFSPQQAENDQTPMGVMTVNYILPGKVGDMMRFGQGYRHLISLWMLLSSVVTFFVLINDLRHGRRKIVIPAMTSTPDPQKTEESELTWLEDETGKTEPIYVDDLGRSWKILLDRDTTVGWLLKGNWYANDAQLYGRPWASSAVRDNFRFPDRFHYQLRANKMAGPDGFVVLFACGMMDLIWVLGGWGNTRSEVLGYPSTSNGFKIRRNEWYFLEVRVTESHVEGYINGEFNFKIPRSEVKHPSPNPGFQKGLGLGVWSTLAKFSDIRFLEI